MEPRLKKCFTPKNLCDKYQNTGNLCNFIVKFLLLVENQNNVFRLVVCVFYQFEISRLCFLEWLVFKNRPTFYKNINTWYNDSNLKKKQKKNKKQKQTICYHFGGAIMGIIKMHFQ